MTTLVTGGTGFVGAAVVRALLDRGEAVRVLVRPASDPSNLERLDVEYATGDLRDAATLVPAVKGCRSLYHVAADYRLWTPRPQDLYDSNVAGTVNLLRAAADAGVGRIVYTSSVATLGLPADGSRGDEDTPVSLADMVGHYKRSKFLAEAEVRRLAVEEHLPVVIVNPSTPVGPRDRKPTPTGRVIVAAGRGRIPAFVDTGLNIVHVEDVARGHLLAHDRGAAGERYVLGGDDMMLCDILAGICTLTGRRPPRLRLPRRAIFPVAVAAEGWARLRHSGEPIVTCDALRMAKKRMFFSSAKAVAAMGYAHRPARAALQDAVQWFRENHYLQ